LQIANVKYLTSGENVLLVPKFDRKIKLQVESIWCDLVESVGPIFPSVAILAKFIYEVVQHL